MFHKKPLWWASAVRSVLQIQFFREHTCMFRGNQFHSTQGWFWDFGKLIKILYHNTINTVKQMVTNNFSYRLCRLIVLLSGICALFYLKNTGGCWCGAVHSSSSPLLRITKLQGEQEARQGLVGTHEDAMIIKTVSDFPVSLPSVPRQARLLPDAAADSK